MCGDCDDENRDNSYGYGRSINVRQRGSFLPPDLIHGQTQAANAAAPVAAANAAVDHNVTQNSAAEEEKTNHSLRQPGSINDTIQCCSCEEIFKTGDNGWVCCSSDSFQNITCPTCIILFNLPSAVDSSRAPLVQLVARFVRTPRGASSKFFTLSDCFVPPNITSFDLMRARVSRRAFCKLRQTSSRTRVKTRMYG